MTSGAVDQPTTLLEDQAAPDTTSRPQRPDRDRRAVLVATATVDQDGSSVCLLVADRYGRVREHRRLPRPAVKPTTLDDAERSAAAMRAGHVPPSVCPSPAAGATDTGAAWLIGATSLAPQSLPLSYATGAAPTPT